MSKNVQKAIQAFQAFLEQYWVLLVILVLFVVLRVATTQSDAIPQWDGAVYVGMGKYLYSHGTIGTWEALRPIGLPALLGGLWKLGLNPYHAGTIVSLLFSTGLLILTYLFAERLRPASGAIAATVLAGCEVFFHHSALPITDITSTFFAVWALYLVYRANTNRKYFIAGIVVALAFMFRFPQGLLLVAAMAAAFIKLFYEKGKWVERIQRCIERIFMIAGGFFLIVVPYLVSNYMLYGNAFLPFLEGVAVIKQYPSLYQKGLWFYPLELLKQDPLFVCLFIPLGLLFSKKQRSIGVAIVGATLLIIFSYFTYEVHKETRFLLAFLPYIAILTGIGIVYLLERFKMPPLLFFGLFVIAGFMLHASVLVHPVHNPDNKPMHDFESYLSKVPHARILSSTPNFFVYSDVFQVRNLYLDWNDAYKAYTTFQDQADYMAFSSCNLETSCADNAHCKDDKQLLLTALAQHDTEVFSTTTPSQCVLSIYKLSHS